MTVAAPTPRVFYVHDDLTDEVRSEHGTDSPAFRLTQQLLRLVRRDAARVVVLTVEDQIDLLVTRGAHAPFEVTIVIGRAGERVARDVHARTGWFPALRRVDVAREEDGRGGYRVVSLTAEPLSAQLRQLDGCASVAVVDDTVFSGLTMRTVLGALSPGVRARAHAFCLRSVADTLSSIAALCPVTTGIAAPGRILDDVSFINASGLVRRVAIRRAGGTPLAFFERPEWIRAWFPEHHADVIALCRELNALLEPPA